MDKENKHLFCSSLLLYLIVNCINNMNGMRAPDIMKIRTYYTYCIRSSLKSYQNNHTKRTH